MSGIPIDIQGLEVRYRAQETNEVAALDRIDLSVPAGELVAILGPSGCGKTTMLNVLAGFIPYAGRVTMGDRPPGRRRDIGYLFQRDTLLPWRSLASNVGFALEVRGVDAHTRAVQARAMLDRLGLGGFADAYPHEVSGGMAKRAALAQALIHSPPLVLLDEPFGALDAFTRASVEQDLLQLLAQSGATALFVTHNLQEAIALSDRVIVMSARPGRVIGDHAIDLARPRDVLEVQYTEAFARFEREIWSQLRGQVVA
ncbi:MAG: ABC transporter ATP-binding protein [Chloroflexota bacterium]|nr:ABC transporter ATP-binding protein [Chloroflexota bacterium]